MPFSTLYMILVLALRQVIYKKVRTESVYSCYEYFKKKKTMNIPLVVSHQIYFLGYYQVSLELLKFPEQKSKLLVIVISTYDLQT